MNATAFLERIEREDGLDLTVSAGCEFHRACREALQIARSEGRQVRFTFNSCKLTAGPGSSIDDLCSQWDAHLKPFRERQRKEDLVRAAAPDLLQSLKELIANTYCPETNCSCHISPPCSDCVEWAGIREILANARAAVAKAEGGEA